MLFNKRFLILLPLVFLLETAYSLEKLALVVGNASYKESPLHNPAKDASEVAKTLSYLGFKVTLKHDFSKKQMMDEIRRFGQTLRGTDSVGLFFTPVMECRLREQTILSP